MLCTSLKLPRLLLRSSGEELAVLLSLWAQGRFCVQFEGAVVFLPCVRSLHVGKRGLLVCVCVCVCVCVQAYAWIINNKSDKICERQHGSQLSMASD
jgi:hypothetical protein